MSTPVLDRLTVDPQAKLNISWDWTDWLPASVTISSQSVTIAPSGPTVSAPIKTGNMVTVRVEGLTLNQGYRLTCHAVMSNGEEDDRTWYLTCRER
jgi:hypothetical protein